MSDNYHTPRYVSRITRDTLAIVLAGGRGSRLHNLTDWRAKPAVPFGGKFRIIDFPLSNCVNSGIRCIHVLTQYKAQSLISHVHKGWGYMRGQFGEFLELIPAQQRMNEDWYLGTADAVYQNLDIIRANRPKYVLILAGDHIYKMDYGPMLTYHLENNADITVGCIEVPLEDARGYGVMQAGDNHRIVGFQEKPENPPPMPGSDDQALVSMGIYVFNTDFLIEQIIKDHDEPSSKHDFGMNIIPSLIHKYRAFAYPFRDVQTGAQSYWRDVGTIDAYWKANMELIGVTPELNLYDLDWPIWTYQEQLPPAKFVFDDDGRRGMAVDSMVSGGCIVSGSLVRHSLLFSDVRILSYSQIENSVVLPGVRIGRNCTIRNAIIDAHCDIADGTKIGVDPEEDAKRYYVSEGGIVLVTCSMLGQELHYVTS